LLVTINRFYFDTASKKKEKISRHVDVPTQLYLDPGREYKLLSVVIHAGKSSNFGHYYTISRD